MPKPKLKPRKASSHIDVKVKTDGNTELRMNLVKAKKIVKQKTIRNNELETILNKLNSEKDNVKNDYAKDKSILEYLDTTKENNEQSNKNNINNIKKQDKSRYNDVELKHITSPENLKNMVNHITEMQKSEWIEIFRIIKNNEPKNFQENNNGIWIVLNKLEKETVIKLHEFVDYCIKSKKKLEQGKIKISKIKDDLKGNRTKNDEEFIKDSQLLKDINDENELSGYSNSGDGVAGLNGDEDSNLKEQINVEENKLTNTEVHDLLSKRMMMRNKDDESFLVSQ